MTLWMPTVRKDTGTASTPQRADHAWARAYTGTQAAGCARSPRRDAPADPVHGVRFAQKRQTPEGQEGQG